MAELFKIEGGRVMPTAEALLIRDIALVWERGVGDRMLALKELAYVEFMTSKRRSNPYVGYREVERGEAVIRGVGLPEGWEPDGVVLGAIACIEKLNEEGSANYLAYRDSLEVLHNTRLFLKSIDLGERNKAGMPVYKPVDIYNAFEKLEKVFVSLDNLRERVESDLYEQSKTRGGRVVNILEV